MAHDLDYRTLSNYHWVTSLDYIYSNSIVHKNYLVFMKISFPQLFFSSFSLLLKQKGGIFIYWGGAYLRMSISLAETSFFFLSYATVCVL